MARALAAAIKSNDFPAVQKLLPDIPVYPALWSDGRWRQRRRGEGGVQMTHVMLAVVHTRPKILRLLLDSGADVLLDAGLRAKQLVELGYSRESVTRQTRASAQDLAKLEF